MEHLDLRRLQQAYRQRSEEANKTPWQPCVGAGCCTSSIRFGTRRKITLQGDKVVNTWYRVVVEHLMVLGREQAEVKKAAAELRRAQKAADKLHDLLYLK